MTTKERLGFAVSVLANIEIEIDSKPEGLDLMSIGLPDETDDLDECLLILKNNGVKAHLVGDLEQSLANGELKAEWEDTYDHEEVTGNGRS